MLWIFVDERRLGASTVRRTGMKSLRWPGGFVDRRLPKGVGLWWEGGPALARGPRGFPGASLVSAVRICRWSRLRARFRFNRLRRGNDVDRSTRAGRGQLGEAKAERGVRRQKPVSSPRSAHQGSRRSTRVFTRPGVHPFDEVEWELRSATITNERGELIFEQRDCEIPRGWSQLATNVVVSKYFRGHLGTRRARVEREAADRARGRPHPRVGRARRLLPHAAGRRELPARSSRICS